MSGGGGGGGGGGGEVGLQGQGDLVVRLLAQLAELEGRLARVEREREEYRKQYMLPREEIAQLKRGLIGQKARCAPKDDAQLSLALGVGQRAKVSTELVGPRTSGARQYASRCPSNCRG